MADFTLYWYPKQSRYSSRQRLARAAALYLGLETEGAEDILQTQTTDRGKPYFLGRPDLFCSVTHSGDYWIGGFGPAPLGVDLQFHQQCNRQGLANRFFHPNEQTYLALCDYTDFFRVWSAKESYVKYTGQGIDGAFSKFFVASETGMQNETEGAELRFYPFHHQYSLYLCAEKIDEVRFLPGK